MASGLPVIVSSACGCASDLVKDEVNGWTFDPKDERRLTSLMIRVAMMSDAERRSMGKESQAIISDWDTNRFADGLTYAARCALCAGSVRAWFINRLILFLLLRR